MVDSSLLTLHFENQHFVIINKEAGFLSVPSRLGANDERPCCGRILEQQLQIQIYPVHRLDEPVSGLLLFAKNPQAQKIANSWFEQHSVKKRYEALTEFKEAQSFNLPHTFDWKSKILRGKKRAYSSPHGKDTHTLAILKTRGIEHYSWDLFPVTGRSHQLRFDLSSRGFPILGDELYGAKPWKHQGIALQLVDLDFTTCKSAAEMGLSRHTRSFSF